MVSEEYVESLISCIEAKKKAMDGYGELLRHDPTEGIIEKMFADEESHLEKLNYILCQTLKELKALEGTKDGSGRIKKLRSKLEKALKRFGVDCSKYSKGY